MGEAGPTNPSSAPAAPAAPKASRKKASNWGFTPGGASAGWAAAGSAGNRWPPHGANSRSVAGGWPGWPQPLAAAEAQVGCAPPAATHHRLRWARAHRRARGSPAGFPPAEGAAGDTPRPVQRPHCDAALRTPALEGEAAVTATAPGRGAEPLSLFISCIGPVAIAQLAVKKKPRRVAEQGVVVVELIAVVRGPAAGPCAPEASVGRPPESCIAQPPPDRSQLAQQLVVCGSAAPSKWKGRRAPPHPAVVTPEALDGKGSKGRG